MLYIYLPIFICFLFGMTVFAKEAPLGKGLRGQFWFPRGNMKALHP